MPPASSLQHREIPIDQPLFPLSLTPFEQYYLFDNRPEYPTTFPADLHVRGTPIRGEFESAIRLCLQRHPLLSSRVVKRGRFPSWTTMTSHEPPVLWSCPCPESADPYFDLASTSGLRVLVHVDPEAQTSRIRLLFHHACCDAVGAVQFIEDVLIAYHSNVTGSGSEFHRRLDPQRLRMRGDYGLTAAGYRRSLRNDLRIAQACLELSLRQPQILMGRTESADHSDMSFATQAIEPELLQNLRRFAKSHEASLNDLLLRDMFLALRDWNASPQSRRPFRITVPTNLRSRADKEMPSTNVLSFAFLSRHPKACDDPAQLLISIRDQMNAIKEHRLGLYFIGGISFASKYGLLKWALRGQRSFSTVVLSNVGRVFSRCPLPKQDKKLVSGNLLLERFEGVPPIRPGTRSSLALITYAGQTCLNLRCDPAYFAKEDTREFLTTYLDRLQQTAQS